MNKYFIEYPKHKLFVCYDGKNSYLNMIINHCDNEYVFMQFVYRNIKIVESVKKMIKLREKNDALYSLICMIIDRFVVDSRICEKGEFRHAVLPEKNIDKNGKIEYYPRIHICTNDYYYDTYPGKILYNRLKKGLPLIHFNF